MSFNSFDFAFFLLVVYLLFRGHFHASKAKNLFLLCASLLFYMWWHPVFVLVLLYSSLSDYWIALAMAARPRERRGFMLAVSLVNNLGLLFVFKYLGALCGNVNLALGWTPLSFRVIEPSLVLPIGISFYTFQSLSYTIDVCRGTVPPLRRLDDFLLYVTFFPQLVAGPILRAKQFIPQLFRTFEFRPEAFHAGVFLILFGLTKKLCIADPLGIYLVDPVYNRPEGRTALEAVVATYAYAFQLYNDFSGYSDIAIGSAMLFGFSIPANFDAPLLSTNPVDFWNRWHISLSHWVRDYLFYPLCASDRLAGWLRLNLFITIVAIGVWHGARWTYLWFGLYHACLVVGYHTVKDRLPRPAAGVPAAAWTVLCWAFFFHLVCVADWLFRSDSVSAALAVAARLVADPRPAFGLQVHPAVWFSLALALATHPLRAAHLSAAGARFAAWPLAAKVAVAWGFFCLWMAYDFVVRGQKSFIYFQF